NTFLYGAIIALVVIVLGLGFSQYSAHRTGLTGDTVVASEDIADAIGTDEDAAEHPDATVIASDAAVDATAEAKQAVAEDSTGDETATSETTQPAIDPVTGVATQDSATAETATGETQAAGTDEATPAADAAVASDEESLLAAPAALQMNVA